MLADCFSTTVVALVVFVNIFVSANIFSADVTLMVFRVFILTGCHFLTAIVTGVLSV